jgi:hypothetical protein
MLRQTNPIHLILGARMRTWWELLSQQVTEWGALLDKAEQALEQRHKDEDRK